MKLNKTLWILLFMLVSCISHKNELGELNPENYFTFETKSYERESKKITSIFPKIIENKDSIGVFINMHKSRFRYILNNRLEKEVLKTFYPDTAKVEFYFKENLKKDIFYNNFKTLVLMDKTKKTFSQKDMMSIASRFFLFKKHLMINT